MNKAYGIAALVGYLGFSSLNPATVHTQGKDEQVKFGSNREVTYTPARIRADEMFSLPPLTPKSWGVMFIDDVSLTLRGVLDGTKFLYHATPIARVLEIDRNGSNIRYVDAPLGNYKQDAASVNGHDVLTENSGFFETTKPSQTSTPNSELLEILIDFKQKLNIGDAEKKAQAMRDTLTPDELKKTLDAFKK